MEEAIRIRDLEKSFKGHLGIGRFHALNSASLTVSKGVIYGFLGPNGAGKTTTLKILTGMLFPDKGEVTMLGEKLHDVRTRRNIGFLPESPYFYDYLSGEELLYFMGRLYGLPDKMIKERVAHLLKLVGMEGRAKGQLRKYSKGMLQRIGLAQALINDPELVILDEPMTGLDPIGRREFRDLILDLKTQGKTVFFSSHILSDAESICDQVAILVRGKVVREGHLADLLSSQVQFWDVSFRTAKAFSAPVGSTLHAQQEDQILLRVEKEESLQAVLDSARQQGAMVQAVVPHKVSLEEIFMAEIPGERS